MEDEVVLNTPSFDNEEMRVEEAIVGGIDIYKQEINEIEYRISKENVFKSEPNIKNSFSIDNNYCLNLKKWIYKKNKKELKVERRKTFVKRFEICYTSISLFFNLTFFALYISETYYNRLKFDEEPLKTILFIEFLLNFYFIVEYVINLIQFPRSKIIYFFSIYAIIDKICIISVFLNFFLIPLNTNISFLRVIRILRLVRRIRTISYMTNYLNIINQDNNSNLDPRKLHIFYMALTIIIYFLIGSGLTLTLQDFYEDGFNIKDMNFFDSFYFSIISLTSVGYGDIFPVNRVVRFVVILFIFFTIYFISDQISKMVNVLRVWGSGLLNFTASDHIVIFSSSLNNVKNFITRLNEFDREKKFLIVSETELKISNIMKEDDGNVSLIICNIQDQDFCDRTNIRKASEIFIFSNFDYIEELNNILDIDDKKTHYQNLECLLLIQLMKLHKDCPHIPIYIFTFNLEKISIKFPSMKHMESHVIQLARKKMLLSGNCYFKKDINIKKRFKNLRKQIKKELSEENYDLTDYTFIKKSFCLRKIKNLMLSKASINPGFLTFTQNLFFKHDDSRIECYLKKNNRESLFEEYHNCSYNQLVIADIPKHYLRLSFINLVKTIYFSSMIDYSKINGNDNAEIDKMEYKSPILVIGVIKKRNFVLQNFQSKEKFFLFPINITLNEDCKLMCIVNKKDNNLQSIFQYQLDKSEKIKIDESFYDLDISDKIDENYENDSFLEYEDLMNDKVYESSSKFSNEIINDNILKTLEKAIENNNLFNIKTELTIPCEGIIQKCPLDSNILDSQLQKNNENSILSILEINDIYVTEEKKDCKNEYNSNYKLIPPSISFMSKQNKLEEYNIKESFMSSNNSEILDKNKFQPKLFESNSKRKSKMNNNKKLNDLINDYNNSCKNQKYLRLNDHDITYCETIKNDFWKNFKCNLKKNEIFNINKNKPSISLPIKDSSNYFKNLLSERKNSSFTQDTCSKTPFQNDLSKITKKNSFNYHIKEKDNSINIEKKLIFDMENKLLKKLKSFPINHENNLKESFLEYYNNIDFMKNHRENYNLKQTIIEIKNQKEDYLSNNDNNNNSITNSKNSNKNEINIKVLRKQSSQTSILRKSDEFIRKDCSNQVNERVRTILGRDEINLIEITINQICNNFSKFNNGLKKNENSFRNKIYKLLIQMYNYNCDKFDFSETIKRELSLKYSSTIFDNFSKSIFLNMSENVDDLEFKLKDKKFLLEDLEEIQTLNLRGYIRHFSDALKFLKSKNSLRVKKNINNDIFNRKKCIQRSKKTFTLNDFKDRITFLEKRFIKYADEEIKGKIINLISYEITQVDFRNHILIYGLDIFDSELIDKLFFHYKNTKILILGDDQLYKEEEIKKNLHKFSNLIYVIIDPLFPENLEKLNLKYVLKCFLLIKNIDKKVKIDMINFQLINYFNHKYNFETFIEQNSEDHNFLLGFNPKINSNLIKESFYHPLYMSGKVLYLTKIKEVCSETYLNEYITEAWLSLIYSGYPNQNYARKGTNPNIITIDVPDFYNNKDYIQLIRDLFLTKISCIPLGLYITSPIDKDDNNIDNKRKSTSKNHFYFLNFF